MTVNLRPCPACGSKNVKLEAPFEDVPQLKRVRCTDISCGLTTGTFALEGKHGVELWNNMLRRTDIY